MELLKLFCITIIIVSSSYYLISYYKKYGKAKSISQTVKHRKIWFSVLMWVWCVCSMPFFIDYWIIMVGVIMIGFVGGLPLFESRPDLKIGHVLLSLSGVIFIMIGALIHLRYWYITIPYFIIAILFKDRIYLLEVLALVLITGIMCSLSY